MGHDRSGRHDTSLPDHTVVHDDGAHADKHIVLDGAAVYDGVVAYAHIVAHHGREFLVGAMDGGVVLNVDLVAEGDAVHIAAHDAAVPKATAVAAFELANYNGGLRQKTIGPKFRRMT